MATKKLQSTRKARPVRNITARLSSLRVEFLALGLLIACLVAACGDGLLLRDALTSEPVGSQDALPVTSTSEPAESQEVLPGTEAFGLSEEGLVEAIEAVESLIAECMNEAGAEYIAVDYDTVRRGMNADKSLPGLSERQFLNQYGFGISTLYTGLPPQLADENTPAKIGLGEQNIKIFNNLSPADQVAYNRTLFGENSDATFAVAIEIEDFSRTDGCTRAAIEQVFLPEQLSSTYLSPRDALIEQDPRMIAALAEVAECLHAEGFDYTYEREIVPDLWKRLYAITEGETVESLSADAQGELTILQAEERALAVDVYDCDRRFLDPVEDEVEEELFGD